MSIQIVDNFKLNLAVPIDSRMVTTGQLSRNSIKYVYEGLRVYDIVEKTPYVWIDGTWQKESSVGIGSTSPSTGGSTPPPPTVATTNRIVKYTSSITIGESSIVDKGNYANPNVGIGKNPSNAIALDVLGMVKANSFIGTINGSYLDVKSLDISKIKPHTVTTGDFALKTIGGQVIWTSATSLNLDIVINNETSNTGTHYLLFTNTSNSPTGTRIYANNGGTRLIGIKPSTSQILASGDLTNNATTPSYTFSGTTNAGLYGNINEVGLSFNSKSLLKLNSTNVSIFDTTGIEVLKTATGKVICTTGEFSGALSVTGLATLGSLKVNTGTNTFTIISPVDLNILTGGSAIINNLTVSSTSTTAIPSLSTPTLNVNVKLKTTDLEVTGVATFQSLTLTSLSVSSNTTFSDLNVTGYTNIASSVTNPIRSFFANTLFSTPLVVKAPISGSGDTLSVGNLSLRLTATTGFPPPYYIGPGFGNTTVKFKEMNVDILDCSKVRILTTAKSIADKMLATDWNYYPYNFDSGYGFPIDGFVPGDIIYVKWYQPATKVYSNTVGKYVSASGEVGYHLFYTGPEHGWLYAQGSGDPYNQIDPNPAPYTGGYVYEEWIDTSQTPATTIDTGNGGTDTDTDTGTGGGAGGQLSG